MTVSFLFTSIISIQDASAQSPEICFELNPSCDSQPYSTVHVNALDHAGSQLCNSTGEKSCKQILSVQVERMSLTGPPMTRAQEILNQELSAKDLIFNPISGGWPELVCVSGSRRCWMEKQLFALVSTSVCVWFPHCR